MKKSTITNKLDKLVGTWCRSLGYCEAQGYQIGENTHVVKCTPQLQWCHIKSRRYRSVRWSPNNCLCMCAAHHRWFTDHPDDFGTFLYDRYPERKNALDTEFRLITKTNVIQMQEQYEKLVEELPKFVRERYED